MSKKVKVKLTRPDGTVLEVEGDLESVLQAILAFSPPPPAPFVLVQPLVVPQPLVGPLLPWYQPEPAVPFIWNPEIICTNRS